MNRYYRVVVDDFDEYSILVNVYLKRVEINDWK